MNPDKPYTEDIDTEEPAVSQPSEPRCYSSLGHQWKRTPGRTRDEAGMVRCVCCGLEVEAI
jgi:hypothetical protein